MQISFGRLQQISSDQQISHKDLTYNGPMGAYPTQSNLKVIELLHPPKKTKWDSMVSESPFLCGRMIIPPCENTRSIGADEAGTVCTFLANWNRIGRSCIDSQLEFKPMWRQCQGVNALEPQFWIDRSWFVECRKLQVQVTHSQVTSPSPRASSPSPSHQKLDSSLTRVQVLDSSTTTLACTVIYWVTVWMQLCSTAVKTCWRRPLREILFLNTLQHFAWQL